MLKPIPNAIFFIFEDDTTNVGFTNKSTGGLLLASGAGPQSDVARWGVVIRTGEEVDLAQPGDYILVEPGMWTTSFDTAGVRLWKTDISKVMLVSAEKPTVGL